MSALAGSRRRRSWSPDWRIVLALALAVLTWLSGQPAARTVAAAEPIVSDGRWTLVQGSEVVHGADGTALVSSDGRRVTRVQREIEFGPRETGGFVRLRLSVTSLSSDAPLMDWHGTRVTIAYVAEGHRLGWASTVQIASWSRVADIDSLLRLPASTDALHVTLVVPHAGAWQLSEPSLVPVVAASWQGPVVASLLAGWATLLVWLLLPACRGASAWKLLGSVLVGLAVVVLGTGLSRTALAPFAEPVVAALGAFSDASSAELGRTVQKGGHFVAFFALTLALWWWRRRLALGAPSIVLLGVAVAVGTEALQLYVDGRSSRMSDVVIDVGGIASALLVVGTVRLLFRSDGFRRIAAGGRSG